MKPCKTCPSPAACAKAGKCKAAPQAPQKKPPERKTGRFYIHRAD